MTQKPNGGAAFPRENSFSEFSGMSLRDYFAGQALSGLLAGRGGPLQRQFIADEAGLCHEYADAMIAVREQGK